MSERSAARIAVVNSNRDTTEMLRECLQQNGYTSVVIGHVAEIKRGETDFLEFVATHDPQVFVWDIGIPYEENWRFVHLLMDGEQMRGRRFVLTTTNKRVLDGMVGGTETLEIIGKPYDLNQIVKAVDRAAGISPESEMRSEQTS